MAWARATKSCTASYCESCSAVGGGWRRGKPSGGTGYSCSAQVKWYPARGQHLHSRCGLKQIPDGGGGFDEMLDVVEDEEQCPGRQEVPQAVGQRLPALLSEAQRRRNGR